MTLLPLSLAVRSRSFEPSCLLVQLFVAVHDTTVPPRRPTLERHRSSCVVLHQLTGHRDNSWSTKVGEGLDRGPGEPRPGTRV